MVGQTPNWLTDTFILKALQDKEKRDDIIVCDITVENPIPKGSNYICTIYRATVRYKYAESEDKKKMSFIIKTPIENSSAHVFTDVIKKENRLYDEYLTKVIELFDDEDYVTAKSYYSEDKSILILEDLNFAGYKMVDRLKRMDFDHCVLTFKTLARFHAASVKIHEKYPELVEGFGKAAIFRDGDNPATKNFSEMGFKLLAIELQRNPEMTTQAKRIQEYSEHVWDMLMNCLRPRKGEFSVLAHGDFWSTNMLFKYDPQTGKPISAKMIDFQESKYTSPVIDLIYALTGSVQEDVRSSRLDELIAAYLKELNENLKRFGCSQQLDTAELMKYMKNREFYGLYVSISLMPWFLADPNSEIIDLGNAFTEFDLEKTPLKSYYKNRNYINLVCKRFSEYKDLF